MSNAKHVTPTGRGKITIPKDIRKKLGITSSTKLKVYLENNKIVVEPVSPLDLLFQDIEQEAKDKGYTEDDLMRDIELVREKLVNELTKS
ncbi:MAG: AbrB/MazE/SpoVT family DNA-binding domain-containing protein [Bacillota bacterium]